jgi:hypothetical protein
MIWMWMEDNTVREELEQNKSESAGESQSLRWHRECDEGEHEPSSSEANDPTSHESPSSIHRYPQMMSGGAMLQRTGGMKRRIRGLFPLLCLKGSRLVSCFVVLNRFISFVPYSFVHTSQRVLYIHLTIFMPLIG